MRFVIPPDILGYDPSMLAGPVEIRLPCAQWARWSPSVAQSMIGQVTKLAIGDLTRAVLVDKAVVDTDPQFLLLTLVAA